MAARTKHGATARGERLVAGYVPYSAHVSPTVVTTHDGDLLTTWRVEGIPYETADPEEITTRKEALNTLLRSIGSSKVSIWVHTIRRPTTGLLDAEFPDAFTRGLDERYRASLDAYEMMRTNHYLTLVYRPRVSKAARVFARAGRRTLDAILAEQHQAIDSLEELARQVESGLDAYGVERLTAYDRAGVRFSHLLSFLEFLTSGHWQEVRVPTAPLNEALGSAWIYAGTETLELRQATRTRYAQAIEIKDYPEHTAPGMLDGLLYSDFPFIATQSFSFSDRQAARERMTRQKNMLANAGDGSATQQAGILEAIDELLQGRFAVGEYHFSLMVLGESVASTRRDTAEAATLMQDQGFFTTLASTALDGTWFAQLPGNWQYRPRVASLTSLNFASLTALHGFVTGKREGNAWGQAVTMFRTPSSAPLYFNFHQASDDDDRFGSFPLGSVRVIGQSESGKTVLLNFLLAQAQKFASAPMTTVFFDKDRGARIAIQAIGGKYLAIQNGVPTGFNPFQLESTAANRHFLESLVAVLVTRNGASVSTSDERRIGDAVAATMRMPKPVRRLSTLLQNMTEGRDRENSVVKRLARWCADDGTGKQGSLAWVLDCDTDEIDLDTHRVYGFDGTSFLDDPHIRTPIALYLLHRIEQAMDGRRFPYFMDEAWKWVDDEAFADFAKNKQLTIRKQNGLGVFATQMPSSLLESAVAAELVQQVATEIYLPNPLAIRDEYINGFGLTETEYQTVRELPAQSRTFVLKTAFRQGRRSVIARLDLAGFDDDLAVLSGSTENNDLLDRVIADVGDDPDVWLPVFHQRRRARDAAARLQRMHRHESTPNPDRRTALLELDRPRSDPDHGRG